MVSAIEINIGSNVLCNGAPSYIISIDINGCQYDRIDNTECCGFANWKSIEPIMLSDKILESLGFELFDYEIDNDAEENGDEDLMAYYKLHFYNDFNGDIYFFIGLLPYGRTEFGVMRENDNYTILSYNIKSIHQLQKIIQSISEKNLQYKP